MKGYLVSPLAIASGRDVAYCRTEKVWHVLSNEDDIKADKKRQEEADAFAKARLPIGSAIGNR